MSHSPTIHNEVLPTSMKLLGELPLIHSMIVLVILTSALATAVEFKNGGGGSSGVIKSNVNGPQG